MITELQIEGFKKFRQSNVHLKNLKRINLLVGQNGSGKSSVLEAIAFTAQIFHQPTNNLVDNHGNYFEDYFSLFKNPTRIVYSEEDSKYELILHPKTGEPWHVVISGRPKSNMSVITMWHKRKRTPDAPFDRYIEFTFDSNLKNIFEAQEFLKKTQRTLGSFYQLELANGLHLLESISDTDSKSDRQEIRPRHVAEGLKVFAALLQVGERIRKENHKFLLIDDLGDQLHPGLRKQILPFINESMAPMFNSALDTQVFATTHNIEIVKSALEHPEYCNVYMFDYAGKLIDFNAEENRQLAEFSSGLTGKKGLRAIAEMLGFSDEDLGFPEKIILVEESSKKAFLDVLLGRFQTELLECDVLVPMKSSDGKFDEKVNELLGLRKYFVLSQVWNDRMLIFIDHNKQYFENGTLQEAQRKKWKAIDQMQNFDKESLVFTKINEEFVESLEETYPLKLWSDFKILKKISESTAIAWVSGGADHAEKGKRKCELAKYIAEKITLEEFIKYYPDLYKHVKKSST